MRKSNNVISERPSTLKWQTAQEITDVVGPSCTRLAAKRDRSVCWMENKAWHLFRKVMSPRRGENFAAQEKRNQSPVKQL
jgi:hypothetical protein